MAGFFFQAEDGIRDFCLSRGLGDVYKRQAWALRSRWCFHRRSGCGWWRWSAEWTSPRPTWIQVHLHAQQRRTEGKQRHGEEDHLNTGANDAAMDRSMLLLRAKRVAQTSRTHWYGNNCSSIGLSVGCRWVSADVTSHYPQVAAARIKSDNGGILLSPNNLSLR